MFSTSYHAVNGSGSRRTRWLRSHLDGKNAAGAESTVACEALELRRLMTVTVGNNSFETPTLSGGSSAYQYDPSGATWAFTGNAGSERNGSGFGAPTAPNGMQAAFIQSNVTAGEDAVGAVGQTLTFPIGTYSVSFDASWRAAKSVLPLEFLVDGAQIGSVIAPTSSTSFTAFTTAGFSISTAGSHTIEFLGVDSTTADKDSFIDLVTVNTLNATPPTVATSAAATPSPVTGTSTALSVLGADVAGESNLTYTWATTGTPPAAAAFSANGTNASKNTAATFTVAGSYAFQVTITDPSGLTATSSVSVNVNQTLTSISVTPTSATIAENTTQLFTANALDQFGNALTPQPGFTWSKTGVGSISSTSGLYTAPATTGTATVSADSGAVTSSGASVSVVVPGTPTVAAAAAAAPSPVTGTTAALSVLGADSGGEAILTYTWMAIGTPPAVVSYSANGTNAAKNTTASFSAAGTYNFVVTIATPANLTTTSSVSVTVNQTITSITVTPRPSSVALGATQQYTAFALDQFGTVLATQPTFTWSTAGQAGTSGSTLVGSISTTGLFTASSSAGNATVTATAGGVFTSVPVSVGGASIVNGTTTLSTFGTNAYYAVDTNSCSIDIDSVWTDPGSNYQFAAYYTTASEIMIARRQVGASTWQVFDSGIADSTISDDHDIIAIAVDSAGFMHMSWGMHNIPLQYAISNTIVNAPSLTALTFTIETSTIAPTLFPNSGNDTNEVTYPQFYAIPDSPNLLFAYRDGGAGGGSGNGNEYIDVYSPGSKTWSHTFMINGELTSVNAYLNRMVFDSSGNLLTSWTWRATPNWQTNSNIMFAQSPDDGTSWYQKGGTAEYGLPIIQSGTPANSVAQVIENIPENSSFINQTSMTVDANNNPIIATYLAPGWNTSTNSGNPNRQYMLYYYYNGQWNSTQVSNRTSDTSIDTSGSDVRDLGRPIVLIDKQGRVLVVTRSEDTSMGAYASASTPNNDIVVYYSTSLDSANPSWKTITLNTTNMGDYEPTYDQNLWNGSNELSLFYEPVGLTSQTNGTVQTLDWNEQAYFNGTAPSVAIAAAANPSPVTGMTTKLSVLGADNSGEASLTYTWSVTGTPPAAVTFSDNGDNTAKNTTATFTQPGTYSFLVAISDAGGLTTTSSVSVKVDQAINLTGSTFYLKLDHASPRNLDIWTNSTATGAPVYVQEFDTVTSITLSAAAGGDNFTADFSNGSVVPTGGLSFAGFGAANNNSLTIVGSGGTDSVTASAAGVYIFNGQQISYSAGQIGKIYFETGGNSESLTVAAGTVTLAPGGGTGVTTDLFAGVNISSEARLNLPTAALHANRLLLETGTISLAGSAGSWSGILDLSNNDLDVAGGSLSTLTNQVAQGLKGTGGIVTSAASADSTHLTTLGVIQNSINGLPTGAPLYGSGSTLGLFDGANPSGSDVLVKYTYYGDANLNGKVDGGDYSQIDNGFLKKLTGWANGDFDYNGTIDGSDYALIDNAFNTQGAIQSVVVAAQIFPTPTEVRSVPFFPQFDSATAPMRKKLKAMDGSFTSGPVHHGVPAEIARPPAATFAAYPTIIVPGVSPLTNDWLQSRVNDRIDDLFANDLSFDLGTN